MYILFKRKISSLYSQRAITFRDTRIFKSIQFAYNQIIIYTNRSLVYYESVLYNDNLCIERANYAILFVAIHVPVAFLSNLVLNAFSQREIRVPRQRKKISTPSSIEELNTITLAISTCRAIIGKRLDANV